MPLTPQDVQNKVFSPTRFRTGYNEDEVDAFLDEVEAELTRLLDENADLRRQLDEARRSGGGGGGGAPTQLMDENTQLRRQLDDARRQVQMAQSRAAQQERPAPSPSTGPTAVPTAQPAAARGPGRGEVDVEIEQRVARTLVFAQRTADEALREARADADRILGEARAHVAEQLGMLEDDKRRLEGQVEQLRAFEREYHTRLRAYLEMQLRDLDGMPSQAAVGAGTVPRPLAGAGGQAGPGGPAAPGGMGPGGGPGRGTAGPAGPGGPATAPFPAGAVLGAPTAAHPAAHGHGPAPRPPEADAARRDGGPGLTDF